MKVISWKLVGMVALVVHGVASAYELGTHGKLTYEAYKRSVLSDSLFLSDLGIQNGKNPFGETYYDVSDSTVKERTRQQFEQQEKRMPGGTEPLSVEGWLMRGAIREDDAKGEENPQDDPFNPDLRRPLHHFYDPVLNRPLTVNGLQLIDSDVHKAPDWAVGSRDAFTQPNTPESNRRNHFTVFDAREAMYRALTGRDSQGNVVGRDAQGNHVPATEADRNKYWATTFRALGDIAHLLQDMGQPQHTRNDQHAGKTPTMVTGEESVFEKYIDARAKGDPSYNIDGTKVTPLQLAYNGYPLPTFTKYSDFWSTRNGAAGRGLADYSNRGFFSAGTNLGSSVYEYPSNNAANYTLEPVRFPQKTSFLWGNVYDYMNPGTANIRMTTESMWDLFLTTWKTYSLNRYNYDAMADLLIPRSVAYSAGLINYFFRGKIDFVLDPNNPGAYIIKNLGSEAMTGTFTLYYDDMDGVRQPVPGATWDLTIAANSQYAFVSFATPTSPTPKMPGDYMLVFNGDMGEEKKGSNTVGAVVSKKVSSAPNFYVRAIRGSQLIRFSGAGDYLDMRYVGGGSNYVNGLLVYGPDVYHIETTGSSVTDHAFKNGDPFLAEVASLNDMAGNSSEIFVAAVYYTGDPVVKVYDRNTNFLRSFTVNPLYYFNGSYVQVAANDHYLVSSDGGSMSIYDTAGSRFLTLSGWSIYESILAVSSDRIYRANMYWSIVDTYGFDGLPHGSLPTVTGDIVCMDATDSMLYIVTRQQISYANYKGRLSVFVREGTDTYRLLKVTDIPDAGNPDYAWFYACSVDRAAR